MADIYYLRPVRKADAQAEPLAAAPRLTIALSVNHLAAILVRETLLPGRGGQPGARLKAMMSGLGGAGGQPVRSAGIELALDIKYDVLLIDSVRSGKVKIRPVANASAASSLIQLSAAKIQAEFINVPDDVLIARHKRTGMVAFAFHDSASLEMAIDEIIGGNRVMFENWARRGGQPPLYLRHQGKSPFGRIVHEGAESATDLRSVAAKAVCDHAHGSPYFMIELSLSQRKA
jgi:hypothetical protein